MTLLRYLLIGLGIFLLAFHLFTYFSIDEDRIKKTIGSDIPARLIKVDEKTSESVKRALNKLKPLPKEVKEEAEKKYFGRKTLFLPDE